jgi:hypothetical protein
MRSYIPVVALALGLAAPAGAQSTKVKQETKIEIKDGKDVTLTGCVRSYADPSGAARFQLTDVADKEGRLGAYVLVGENDDVAKHVGQLVEIKGKAANQDEGKVKVKTKTEIDREHADDSKTESTSELKGDLNLPLLGVDDVKMIRPTCS